MFVEEFNEEASEIVENVGEFLDGSPMRPSMPIIHKGRLPPKRNLVIKENSINCRPRSPQSRMCSPYSNLNAQCIVDEFAEKTLQNSKLLKRRASRSLAKHVVVSNANTSHPLDRSTRSSILSGSLRQRLSASKRISCTSHKTSTGNGEHSCEQSSVHASVEQSEKLNFSDITHKCRTNRPSQVEESENRPSLKVLYEVYNNSSRKESIRRPSKYSLCASNETKRRSLYNSTQKMLTLSRTSRVSFNKSQTSHSEQIKLEDCNSSASREPQMESQTDSKTKEQRKLSTINQHTSSSTRIRPALTSVLENDKIDKISKSIFRKDNRRSIAKNNNSNSVYDVNNSNQSNNNLVSEQMEHVLQNDKNNEEPSNFPEEHAFDRNIFNQWCTVQSPLAFEENESYGKVESEPLSFQFADCNVVSCKAVSAPNHALTPSARAEYITYDNSSKLMRIEESKSVDNEYHLPTVENSKRKSIVVQRDNLTTEPIAFDERKLHSLNSSEAFDASNDVKPHAYQLTQKMSRLSGFTTNVSTNSIFELVTDEEPIVDRKVHNNNTESFEKYCLKTQRRKSKDDDEDKISNNKKENINEIIKYNNNNNNSNCSKLQDNMKSRKNNVMNEAPVVATSPSSSLPRWQDAFSSLPSSVIDLNTSPNALPPTQSTVKSSCVTKEAHKLKSSLEKEYCVRTNSTYIPTPESAGSIQFHEPDNSKFIKEDEKTSSTNLQNLNEQEEEKPHGVSEKINECNNVHSSETDEPVCKKCHASLSATHNKVRNASLARPLRCRNSRALSTLPSADKLLNWTSIASKMNNNISNNNKNYSESRLTSAQKNVTKRQSILVSKIEIGEDSNKIEKERKINSDIDKNISTENNNAFTSLKDTYATTLREQERVETSNERHAQHWPNREFVRQRLQSISHSIHTPPLTKPIKREGETEEPIAIYSKLTTEANDTHHSHNTGSNDNKNENLLEGTTTSNTNITTDSKPHKDKIKIHGELIYSGNGQMCNADVNNVKTLNNNNNNNNCGNRCEKLPEIVPAGRRKSSHKGTRTPSFI